MNILVIDAQGGGIGRQVVSAIRKTFPQQHIVAVGTNSAATSAMLKAGADDAATGENAVVVCCRTADVIIGPVGIVIADALLGEITPRMAVAVGQSRAKRILIPVNHCDNHIAGTGDMSMAGLIESVVGTLRGLLSISWATPHHSQAASARDFSSRQGLKSAGILYVFQAFQTAELAEKIRRSAKTQLCGVALVFFTRFCYTEKRSG